NRTVLFGGFDAANTALGDSWEYDGTTWTHITTALAPPAGSYPMTFDVGRSLTVLCGGTLWAGGTADTWGDDGAERRHATTNGAPPGRSGHVIAYDVSRARTVLFGGVDPLGNVRNDTWEYDGATWSQISVAASPSPRLWATLTYSVGMVVLFGGTNHGANAETWTYD